MGQPWDRYALTLCPIAAGACSSLNCSPVATSPSHTFCPLSGLASNTQYNVTATAVKTDGTRSKVSLPSTFWTPTNK